MNQIDEYDYENYEEEKDEKPLIVNEGEKNFKMTDHCEFYYDKGLIPFTFSCITTNKNKDGKIKKKLNGMFQGWQQLNRRTCTKHWKNRDKCIALLTGKGITVIDVENAGLKKWNEWIEKNGDIDTWKETTAGGGLHYYFKYDKSFKEQIKVKGYEIDIKNKGCIITAPSEYKCSISGELKKYEWVNHPNNYELIEIPQWLKKKLKPNTINFEKKEVNEKKLINQDLTPILQKYIKQIMDKYNKFKVRKITKNDDGTLYIELKNNKKPCILTPSSTHISNNQYILFDVFTGQYYFKCHSIGCSGKHEHGYVEIIEKCDFNSKIIKKWAKEITEDNKKETKILNRIIDYINKHHVFITGATSDLFLQINYDTGGKRRIKYKNSLKSVLMKHKIRYTLTDNKGNDKKVCLDLHNFFMNHEKRRDYEEMTINALHDEKYYEFNTFDRFDIIEEETKEGDITPFLNHLKYIWSKNDDDKYEYILNWMAHVIQKPNVKTKVALVLMSKPGAGKGIIVDKFSKILGNKYYLHCNDFETVLGNFNSQLEGKFLTFLDECVWGGNKKEVGKLKTFITEKTRQINKKNIPKYTVNCVANTIIASNEDWVIPAGKGARRYFILDLNDKYCGNKSDEAKEYFEKIINIDEYALAHYLYNRDITDFDPTKIPYSSGLQDQQIMGLNSETNKSWV
jgi:hypothetical protein